MRYADITRNDKNPIKRFLQRRRLSDALSLVRKIASPRTIIDFGAGDGEFCRLLAGRFPEAGIFCYEPTLELRQEAAARLQDIPSVVIVDVVEALPKNDADLVFCMEVFEHLPARQTADAVPIEIFAPALVKALFRMTRRFGSFDTQPKNVFRAILGNPPGDRPLVELAADAPYHYFHMGFDYRDLRRKLQEQFIFQKEIGSPAKWLPPWLNSEVYYILRKKAESGGTAIDRLG
jgi:hypothetical protein